MLSENFSNLFFVEGSFFGEKEEDTAGIDECSSDFVPTFEADTQLIVGLGSCSTGDLEVVSFFGFGDFFFLHLDHFESFWGEGFRDSIFGDFSSFLNRNKRSFSREHDLFDA